MMTSRSLVATETGHSQAYGHVKSHRLQNGFAYLSALILLTLILLPFLDSRALFNVVSLTLALNGLFGITMLWIAMADAPYSLRQVHWIFYVTFFSIAPINQYFANVWPWVYKPSDSQVFEAAFLTLIWGVIFAVISGRDRCASQSQVVSNSPVLNRPQALQIAPIMRVVLPMACVVCTIILISVTGVANLFIRTSSAISLESSSMSLVLYVCPRAVVFGSFALLVLNYKYERKHCIGVIISSLCLLLTCFPTALARFNVAAIYLGLAIIMFPAISYKRGLFSFLLISGFLLAYPLLDAFKYITSSNDASESMAIIFESLTAGYSTGNYDAFSIAFWCLDYVGSNGITWGHQLLGSLLFFIPRSIWPSKPVPSGQLVFSSANASFTDISFALPLEGYINFGFLGLVIFAVITGKVVRYFDSEYWCQRVAQLNNSDGIALRLFYPFLLCLFFYFLRGSMMTTVTFLVGDGAVILLLVAVLKILNKGKSTKILLN